MGIVNRKVKERETTMKEFYIAIGVSAITIASIISFTIVIHHNVMKPLSSEQIIEQAKKDKQIFAKYFK